MIILTNTTDKIQVKLGGTAAANQAVCYASFRDTTTTTISASRGITLTNNTTVVDLVASPSASTQRIIDYISIHNADTASVTVTIDFFNNTSLFTLITATLGSGEKLEYQEGTGFKIISTTGAQRITDGMAGSPTANSDISYVLKSTDQSTNSNTFVSITGLEFPVSAGKSYWFRFVIPYDVTNTSTGSAFAITGPAAANIYYYTDVSSGTNTRFVQRGITVYDGTLASAGSPQVTGNIATVEGVVTPTANGNITARFRHQEVSVVSVTQKAGACVQYIEI
jgi:hypothetical protein